jgi:hypothetical protein
MQHVDRERARKEEWRAAQQALLSADWCARSHETLNPSHRWVSEQPALMIYQVDPDHQLFGIEGENEPCGVINLLPGMLAEESSPEPQVRRVAALTAAQIEDFYKYLERWKKETRILSSIQSKIFNQHYQRIMAMGKPVLPLIFSELRNNGGQWYWALECITGHNPAVGATNIPEAKQVWLDYAVEHGYLPADD